MSIESIPERLAQVQARIAAAAVQAGRAPQAVRLIAVSKRQPVEAVCAAYDAGQRDFGENAAQEMQAKAAAVAASGRTPRWHFIGRLQRNKAAAVAAAACMVHGVDSAPLVTALARRAPARLDVLIQVNVAREPQKGGVDPDEMLDLARLVGQHATLRLCGLMTVPPAEGAPEPYFRALATALATLQEQPYGDAAHALSMGMSHDYETAIACGATWVRVGTAIFGERQPGTESKA